MDDFYIGYLPRASKPLHIFLRKIVAIALVTACVIALVLVWGQHPFPSSRFDYGHLREFEGTVRVENLPYVVLSDGRTAGLVGQGKHGVEALDSFKDQSVHFRGTLIERPGSRLIELVPGSVKAIGLGTPVTPAATNEVNFEGEIVDVKCYSGVMNPGAGKVHRGCAARCLHGGIPPALVSGDRIYYLLDTSGKPLSSEWASAHAAERFAVEGTLHKLGEISAIWTRRITAQ